MNSKFYAKTIAEPDLNKLFGQFIGTEEPDLAIALPKFQRMHTNCKAIIEILSRLHQKLLGPFNEIYPAAIADIHTFIETSRTYLEKITLKPNTAVRAGADLNEVNKDPKKMMELMMQIDLPYVVTDFHTNYRTFKVSKFMNELVMTLRNIVVALGVEKQRKAVAVLDLDDKDHLLDEFILRSSGNILELFSFSRLNFKDLFNSDRMNPTLRAYALLALHLIYKKATVVVGDLRTVDVDKAQLSRVIIGFVVELRKILPGCEDAFNIISKSVDTMESKLDDYYKDYLSSGDSSIILHGLITDIAKQHQGSAVVSQQFRKIIKLMTDKMQQKGSGLPPEYAKMLGLVNGTLDELDRVRGEKTKPEKAKAGSKTTQEPKTDTKRDELAELNGIGSSTEVDSIAETVQSLSISDPVLATVGAKEEPKGTPKGKNARKKLERAAGTI